ncbi:MAG: hypothetical protein GXY33_00510 [Phycisphaerae bacterium]|nr:hypothetical protein [Phycisphaerae bacterium]
MLIAAFIAFLLAAAGGATLAALILSGRTPPMALSIGHGTLAATGAAILLLAIAMLRPNPFPLIALILFALAAGIGMVLFFRHLRSRPFAASLIIIHGFTAVVALTTLLLGLVRAE